jgi:hypothetical protein
LAMSPATDGFSVMMRDLDMGQESNSLTVALQVRTNLRGVQRRNNSLASPA